MTSRVVVPAAPLPGPFRAAVRTARLVADDDGLHWISPRGRRTTWRRGPEGPATARVVTAARARGRNGLPAGPLLVIGDAAERPLLVVPVAGWSAAGRAPGRGDLLRGTPLPPLVDALGLTTVPVSDAAVATLAGSGAPVARSAPHWSRLHTVAAAAGAVLFAVGTVLGISRGDSTAWAAVGLAGLLLFLLAGAGGMVAGLLRERRTAHHVAEVRPDTGPRRLLLARREHGPELGVREEDGVERWLPLGRHAGAVAQVRRTPAAVELLDEHEAVVQQLLAERWFPDDGVWQAFRRLCDEAGLPVRSVRGRDRVPPDLGSDLPNRHAAWPHLQPRPQVLGVIGGVLGGLDGVSLLLGADSGPEWALGIA